MSEPLDLHPVTLERLLEQRPDLTELAQEHSQMARAIEAITRASAFLTRLLIADHDAIDVLRQLDDRSPTSIDDAAALARWKQLEMLRIAARDLIGVDDVTVVGANLAALAEDVLQGALEIAGATHDLVIVGMGKLGGSELNYASDVDVMFVGDDGDSAARTVMEIVRGCFRVDAALRPEGRDGPLVRSLGSYESYWTSWAQPWEFQALLKARPVAGPVDRRTQWAAAASNALWTKSFGADELRSIREMKARAESIIANKGLAEREVKRGRGGIRDIEFAVQLLQLVHGRSDISIRSATTLTALQQLGDGGYVDPSDAKSLGDAYRFLRNVEHRLQLVEAEQTHTVPTDSAARSQIARALGYQNNPASSALEAFDRDLREKQALVRGAHERLYFRPLLEAFASGHTESSNAIEDRLTAFGFTDAARTRQAVTELTKGLARSSRLMQQMMPLLFDWLSSSPDPDEGLLGLRKLVAGFRTPTRVVATFRDSPEAARRLCTLLGTGAMFANGFTRDPDLLESLADDEALFPTAPVAERARAALSWHRTFTDRQGALQRFARTEQLSIAASDVLGLIDPVQTGAWRSALAEAVLQVALEEIRPTVPVAIIGAGRFGGDEMSYASDLDVIVVHAGTSAADQNEAEHAAQQLLQMIGDPSPARQVYPLDYDLRPEGKKGQLARSLASCAGYYTNWAETWERQAMIRARVVAGDPTTAHRFMDIVDEFVWERPFTAEHERQVRHLKARMERERLPRGQDPQLNLKLGRGSLSDVEWTVQLLQLRHHIVGTNTLRSLHRLREREIVAGGEADALEDAWRFCDRLRNRWFLVNGGANDALPTNPGRFAVLARSLAMSPTDLRERHLQVTRRARAVMEHLFYGRPDA